MKFKFSPEKVEEFQKKLHRNMKPCPFCGSIYWCNNLTFNNYVHVYAEMDENFKPTGNVIPAFILTCTQCGYMYTFNASLAKVLED